MSASTERPSRLAVAERALLGRAEASVPGPSGEECLLFTTVLMVDIRAAVNGRRPYTAVTEGPFECCAALNAEDSSR